MNDDNKLIESLLKLANDLLKEGQDPTRALTLRKTASRLNTLLGEIEDLHHEVKEEYP